MFDGVRTGDLWNGSVGSRKKLNTRKYFMRLISWQGKDGRLVGAEVGDVALKMHEFRKIFEKQTRSLRKLGISTDLNSFRSLRLNVALFVTNSAVLIISVMSTRFESAQCYEQVHDIPKSYQGHRVICSSLKASVSAKFRCLDAPEYKARLRLCNAHPSWKDSNSRISRADFALSLALARKVFVLKSN